MGADVLGSPRANSPHGVRWESGRRFLLRGIAIFAARDRGWFCTRLAAATRLLTGKAPAVSGCEDFGAQKLPMGLRGSEGGVLLMGDAGGVGLSKICVWDRLLGSLLVFSSVHAFVFLFPWRVIVDFWRSCS